MLFVISKMMYLKEKGLDAETIDDVKKTHNFMGDLDAYPRLK